MKVSSPPDFEGEWHEDLFTRRVYATDASAYQELPRAVAIPRTEADVSRLIQLANETGIGLIPRTAGTSLAGQVVGSGIVVDVSRHFREILEVNVEDGWVRVQPGVIRNELNMALRPHGLLFGPETATANRAMIGGMMGNNSCGANSIVYGTTRDHILGLRGYLSDGREVSMGGGEHWDGPIVDRMRALAEDPSTRALVEREFPKPEIHRRNTGYALDALLDDFDLCRLVAGSEGTLFFITEIKLRCLPLPPAESALLCVHCASVDEALRATQLVMSREVSSEMKVWACELMDGFILEGARRSRGQAENLFWVEGDPEAVLVVELRGDKAEEARRQADQLIERLKRAGLGGSYPIVAGESAQAVWGVRRAGLGVLSNVPGPAKPQPVIEDTAVALDDLPSYIAAFGEVLERLGLECVHYAHAGSGELHLRPLLDLRTEDGRAKFRGVAEEVAGLVKRFRGSLSGEHGDGRLRAEFLEQMIGPEGLALCRRVKEIWDPKGIFNPGKIVDAPPMDTGLRFGAGKGAEVPTVLRWGDGGILRAVEGCNGSGDCRKTALTGGTMCPSYMGTRAERDTTRARANVLRQAWTRGLDAEGEAEAKEVLDLCLSCKGCKRECPSNVDMARMKAEFMQGWYDRHGVPLRTRLFSDMGLLTLGARVAPGVTNRMLASGVVKRRLGIAESISFPKLSRETWRGWMKKREAKKGEKGVVWIFADELTNVLDVEVGKSAVLLLESLGYDVRLADHVDSGRVAISKGRLRKAKALAEENVRRLWGLGTVVGVEPSAVMGFRDEVPDLVGPELRWKADALAGEVLMLEEFLVREVESGRLTFTGNANGRILLHGHCHQKAVGSMAPVVKALRWTGREVVQIPSGCCGMAGSFGYEAEHAELSQTIGELVVLPAVRKASAEDWIVATGTSCRHQIEMGTGRKALSVAEALWNVERSMFDVGRSKFDVPQGRSMLI